MYSTTPARLRAGTLAAALALVASGCATLTEDAMTPIAMSFSDGSSGECKLMNKRGAWTTPVPAAVSVRKSDDDLKFDCKTSDGREAVGSIKSEMGAKIIASAVFLDLGITDAITDKHRKYIDSYTIPITRLADAGNSATGAAPAAPSVYDELQQLSELRADGTLTEAEFQAEKAKILDRTE